MADHESLDIPVGFRFVPTDEELVTYLIGKMLCDKLTYPPDIQEIKASQFYSKPPKPSVEFCDGEREWFYYIHEDEQFDHKQNKRRRMVGDGSGFWQSNEEVSLIDMNGNLFGYKTHLIYFKGGPSKPKKTHWRMDEYRLPIQFYPRHSTKKKWTIGKLTRGRDYKLKF